MQYISIILNPDSGQLYNRKRDEKESSEIKSHLYGEENHQSLSILGNNQFSLQLGPVELFV